MLSYSMQVSMALLIISTLGVESAPPLAVPTPVGHASSDSSGANKVDHSSDLDQKGISNGISTKTVSLERRMYRWADQGGGGQGYDGHGSHPAPDPGQHNTGLHLPHNAYPPAQHGGNDNFDQYGMQNHPSQGFPGANQGSDPHAVRYLDSHPVHDPHQQQPHQGHDAYQQARRGGNEDHQAYSGYGVQDYDPHHVQQGVNHGAQPQDHSQGQNTGFFPHQNGQYQQPQHGGNQNIHEHGVAYYGSNQAPQGGSYGFQQYDHYGAQHPDPYGHQSQNGMLQGYHQQQYPQRPPPQPYDPHHTHSNGNHGAQQYDLPLGYQSGVQGIQHPQQLTVQHLPGLDLQYEGRESMRYPTGYKVPYWNQVFKLRIVEGDVRQKHQQYQWNPLCPGKPVKDGEHKKDYTRLCRNCKCNAPVKSPRTLAFPRACGGPDLSLENNVSIKTNALCKDLARGACACPKLRLSWLTCGGQKPGDGDGSAEDVCLKNCSCSDLGQVRECQEAVAKYMRDHGHDKERSDDFCQSHCTCRPEIPTHEFYIDPRAGIDFTVEKVPPPERGPAAEGGSTSR